MSKKVGIHAPYNWSEAAQMARILADTARLLGQGVTYLSSQSHETGVHPRWDRQVLNFRKHDFLDWAKSCRQIVWFDVQPEKLLEAHVKGVENLLVPLCHRLTPEDLTYLPVFDRIVCPSVAAHLLLTKTAHPQQLLTVGWDSGLPRQRQTRTGNPHKTELTVLLDGRSLALWGAALFSALHLILDHHPQLHVKLLHTRQWNRSLRATASELSRRFRDRFQLWRRTGHNARVELLCHSDWVLCGSLCSSSGYDALEALACGSPVVAMELSPFNEFLDNDHNGMLIKGATEPGKIPGVLQGRPDSRQLLDGLLAALDNREHAAYLRSRSWQELDTRSAAFRQTWRQLWEC